MPKGKLAIVAAFLAIAVLVSGTAVAALAQNGSTEQGTTQSFAARVALILGIEEQKVKDAFSQARKEMRDEALDARLANLVEQGKITQEQADQYKTWWKSRPDIPLGGERAFSHLGKRGFPGGMRGGIDMPSTASRAMQ
ncbi:MAG: hypothetical protein ABIH46_01275 [Chloroflexota bacterium]